jgi:hypothetical protein
MQFPDLNIFSPLKIFVSPGPRDRDPRRLSISIIRSITRQGYKVRVIIFSSDEGRLLL